MEGKKEQIVKCDIYEKDNFYHIEAEMPGFEKENISVECNNGYITIAAEKKEIKEESEDKKFIRKERYYGKARRTFYVGDVLEEEIKAEFTNGILQIEIPKVDKEKDKKTIEII